MEEIKSHPYFSGLPVNLLFHFFFFCLHKHFNGSRINTESFILLIITLVILVFVSPTYWQAKNSPKQFFLEHNECSVNDFNSIHWQDENVKLVFSFSTCSAIIRNSGEVFALTGKLYLIP